MFFSPPRLGKVQQGKWKKLVKMRICKFVEFALIVGRDFLRCDGIGGDGLVGLWCAGGHSVLKLAELSVKCGILRKFQNPCGFLHGILIVC